MTAVEWRDRPIPDRLYRDLARPERRERPLAPRELHEAAILQGFPADYPFQGNKSERFRQVGNAVPPPVSRSVLEALLTAETEEVAA